MKSLLFDDLVVGKIYRSMPIPSLSSKSKKAIYASIEADDHYIGLIYPSQSFVLLGKDESKYHPATKLLSVDGIVGWVWWPPSTEFVQATNEEE